MDTELFYTPIAKVCIDKDNIGRVSILPDAKVTLESVIKHCEICTKASNGKSMAVIFDTRNAKYVEKKARDYFSSQKVTPLTKAAAVIVNLPISRIIGNFFVGINKPSFPTKLFTSEENAVKWIKNYI